MLHVGSNLLVFFCTVADDLYRKGESEGKSNHFPERLLSDGNNEHNEAEEAYHNGKCIFFGEVPFHLSDFTLALGPKTNLGQWLFT